MQQQQNDLLKKNTIKSVIAKSTQDFPLLGNCLYWSFSETTIPYTDFTALLKECGMSEKIAPETRKKSAVIKAIEEFVDGTKGKFRRKVIDDQNVMIFVVVRDQVDSTNQDVTFKTETKIFFDKQTGEVRVSDVPEVRDQILALVKKYEDSYTTDQIRASVLRYVYQECEGIMVREGGGIYFVPETKQVQYQNLRKLVETLATRASCSVDVIPVVDLPESRASLWKAVVGEANSQMAEMRKDIEDITGAPSLRTQELRLERYLKLKTKIQMYETLFQSTAQDLIKELSQIETLFKSKLGAE